MPNFMTCKPYAILILLFFLLIFDKSTSAQTMGIGVGTQTPHPSAALEVADSSKGMLIPRLTMQQRNQITAPAEGLLIYCTDCGIDGLLQIYKGGVWESFLTTTQFSNTTNRLKEGLIANFPFNGNANDLSVNGNNGTVFGATLTTDRFGLLDRAYLFDGVDDYILVPNSPSLNSMTDEFSVSLWVTTENLLCNLLSKGTGSSPSLSDYEGNLELSFFTNGGILVSNNRSIFLAPYLPPGNIASSFLPINSSPAWNNIIVTRKKSTLITSDPFVSLYINGEKVDIINGDYTPITLNETFPLKIGFTLNGNGYHKGKIDDVIIYNRALTVEEISYLQTH
jgi:hypothetical protein